MLFLKHRKKEGLGKVAWLNHKRQLGSTPPFSQRSISWCEEVKVIL
jgi:hypothetical protein